MKCQECHERPATLHFTQVINGQKTEIRVCEVCAKEKGYIQYPEEGFSLHDLISGLFNFDTPNMENSQGTFQKVQELKCPNCGMTFNQFKQIGKFGCATCYHTFQSRLEPIFRRVHAGNTKHVGKIPKRTGVHLQKRKQLEEYKKHLQYLIETEAFEEAAKVRDKIKALENAEKNAGEDA